MEPKAEFLAAGSASAKGDTARPDKATTLEYTVVVVVVDDDESARVNKVMDNQPFYIPLWWSNVCSMHHFYLHSALFIVVACAAIAAAAASLHC